MTDIAFRSFRPDDTEALVELLNRATPADPVSVQWFVEYVLLDTNFDVDGLIVAEDADGQPCGFVYAVRQRGVAGIPVDPAGGWITVAVVDPRARRRGIGGELLTRAMRFLRTRGSRWVQFSGYPPAYFVPGLDPETYPEGIRLLERVGFRTVSRPVAMDMALATYRPPDAAEALRAQRVAEGYAFRPAVAGDLPEVIQFAAEELAPDWGEVIRSSAVRTGRADRILIARDPSGAIAGFATFGAYRGLLERFGPFGVAESCRGLGLGKILLHLALSRMRAEGAHSAWFLWTGRDTPAGRLYLDAGFAVTRTFHVLRAELS